MIIVENITRTYQAKIEFDQYVPLNIEFGEKNTMEDSLMYWRTGSLTDTLMEVGIGKKSNICK